MNTTIKPITIVFDTNLPEDYLSYSMVLLGLN
jgi:hypothetical protein